MTIEELQNEYVEEFGEIEEWDDRYYLIMDIAKEQTPFPEELKQDKYKIDGCQSRVWVYSELIDGKVIYKSDSDSQIVKGIAAMLVNVLSGHTPDEILSTDLHFIDDIGLSSHLSPTRSNGLLAMLKQMRMYAVAFKAQQES